MATKTTKKGVVKNGIYIRGSSYYICVKVNNVQIRKSFGKDRRQAELALAEIRKQSTVGRITDDWSGFEKLTQPKKLKTFAEAAAEYMAERAHNKASTLRTYNEHLKNYLLPEFGHLQVSAIEEQHVAQFLSRIANHLSACRANSTVTLLRSVLKVCVRRKIIEENPADGVPRLREQQADVDPLTKEELELALSKLTKLFKPVFTCLAWTGARPGEMLALRWQDVDFVRSEIHINKSRVKGCEDLPKTGSSERYIPMLPPVVQVLTALKQERKVAELGGNDYVFVGQNGLPLNRHLDTTWSAALKKAGLRHRPSYQLRHTFASICLQQGANPGWVAKVLGHSTLQTTFKHYLRFINDPSKENERIVSMMFEAKEPTKEALCN
jgi:integrase